MKLLHTNGADRTFTHQFCSRMEVVMRVTKRVFWETENLKSDSISPKQSLKYRYVYWYNVLVIFMLPLSGVYCIVCCIVLQIIIVDGRPIRTVDIWITNSLSLSFCFFCCCWLLYMAVMVRTYGSVTTTPFVILSLSLLYQYCMSGAIYNILSNENNTNMNIRIPVRCIMHCPMGTMRVVIPIQLPCLFPSPSSLLLRYRLYLYSCTYPIHLIPKWRNGWIVSAGIQIGCTSNGGNCADLWR